MVKPIRPFFTEESLRDSVKDIVEELQGGGPPMNGHFEKYLDARFAHIDDSIHEIRSDLREMRGDIKGLRLWIVGAVIALATLFFTVIGYHTMVMQSQFQVFSDYVKAETQSQQSKVPSLPKAPVTREGTQ